MRFIIYIRGHLLCYPEGVCFWATKGFRREDSRLVPDFVSMFKIDKNKNRIFPVQAESFAKLGFKERPHLQEWLAHRPNALGEELLIIQKEFDGFAGTKERLDLLALDQKGNLVVIENKLDDSGKDVVWQALKYVSYCANLTKPQIVEIFRQYLKEGNNAENKICEFLEADDIHEVKINTGNSQRMMLVAANFPKEVTNTALWLLGHGISVQCIRVTPYAFGKELLLKIDLIIPTPEAKEFMIGVKAKTDEEKTTDLELEKRQQTRRDFWEKTLESFEKSECRLYDHVSPGKDYWLSAGSGVSRCRFTLVFLRKEIRVELYLGDADREKNKFLFNKLEKQKKEIEGSFGKPLTWERLEEKKASRIKFSKSFDDTNRDNWQDMIEWLVSKMTLFERALREPLSEAASKF